MTNTTTWAELKDKFSRVAWTIKYREPNFTDAVEFRGEYVYISVWQSYDFEKSEELGTDVCKITYTASVTKCAEITNPEVIEAMMQELNEAHRIIGDLEWLKTFPIIAEQ